MINYYEPILDISRYQAPVNWDKMWESGVRLVILRLTVGDYYKDTEFDNFYTNAKARGFEVGVYHVVKPSTPASKQFQKIIASLPFELLDIPLTLDCELADGLPPVTISDNIAALVQSSFDLWKRYPLIYTRGEWWNSNTVSRPIFPKCKLFVARYTTLSHPWLDAPALRPRDWVDWDLWQYSADGNGQGAIHGVGSDDVDKDRSRAQDLPSTIALLNGNPPPPDPEPIGEFMYLAECIYIPPGYTHREIRSRPDSLGSDAGKDGGDIFKGDKNLPVYEIIENSEGKWAHLKKGDVVGWTMYEKGTTVYLKLTPLVPMLQVTAAVDKVPLWYWKDKNGQNKPIMVKPDSASKFFFGATFLVDPEKVDADGDNDYYRVLNSFNASPPAPTPPAGFTGWYCKVSEVVPL